MLRAPRAMVRPTARQLSRGHSVAHHGHTESRAVFLPRSCDRYPRASPENWPGRAGSGISRSLLSSAADQIVSFSVFATRNATLFEALLALIWISSPVAG